MNAADRLDLLLDELDQERRARRTLLFAVEAIVYADPDHQHVWEIRQQLRAALERLS